MRYKSLTSESGKPMGVWIVAENRDEHDLLEILSRQTPRFKETSCMGKGWGQLSMTLNLPTWIKDEVGGIWLHPVPVAEEPLPTEESGLPATTTDAVSSESRKKK